MGHTGKDTLAELSSKNTLVKNTLSYSTIVPANLGHHLALPRVPVPSLRSVGPLEPIATIPPKLTASPSTQRIGDGPSHPKGQALARVIQREMVQHGMQIRF